jgi:hypothetical protein
MAFLRLAESMGAAWARDRRPIKASLLAALPTWPAGHELRAYMIAFALFGAARGFDERSGA